MLFGALLGAGAAASAVFLKDSLLAKWQNTSTRAQNVADHECSTEIIAALNRAKEVYNLHGVNPNFINAIKSIQFVSGDIDEAKDFRIELQKTADDINIFYKEYNSTLSSINSTNTSATTNTSFPTTTGFPDEPVINKAEIGMKICIVSLLPIMIWILL
jgi:hypothetical protein